MTADGPVTQIAIPSAYEPAPVRSSFSTTGGVSRYTTGSDTEGASLIKLAADYRAQEEGHSSFTATGKSNGFLTTTFANGQATERASSGFSSVSSGDLVSPAGDMISTIRSASGRPLSGPEVNANSLITLEGGVTTTVATAASMGIIRQNPATGFYEAVAAPAQGGRPLTPQEQRATQLAADQAELQARMDDERGAKETAGNDAVPTIEPLNDEAETIMSEAAQKLGPNNIDVVAAVSQAIDRGELTPDLQGRLANQLGLDGDQFAAQFDTVKAALTEQATDVLGADGVEKIRSWASNACPGDLRKAMVDHATLGTTRGYAQLNQRYMEALADTPAGRADILASPDAAARGIVEDRATGKLYVNIPGSGRVEWRTAVKQGFIGPKYN